MVYPRAGEPGRCLKAVMYLHGGPPPRLTLKIEKKKDELVIIAPFRVVTNSNRTLGGCLLLRSFLTMFLFVGRIKGDKRA